MLAGDEGHRNGCLSAALEVEVVWGGVRRRRRRRRKRKRRRREGRGGGQRTEWRW
jgi:hypothetical protein